MNQVLREIDRRAYRHEMVDGLTEIAMALVFLVLVIIWHKPGLMWMIILPILALGPGLRKIRSRTTYPRIGYVQPKGEKSAELFRGMALYVLGAVVMVTVGVFLWHGKVDSELIRQVSPLLASLLFGGGLLYAAGRSGLRRFYGVFAISVILGGWISFTSEPGSYDGVQKYLVVMAAILVVLGLATFAVFLQKNPVRDATENEHVG
jgi:hypothetical protein